MRISLVIKLVRKRMIIFNQSCESSRDTQKGMEYRTDRMRNGRRRAGVISMFTSSLVGFVERLQRTAYTVAVVIFLLLVLPKTMTHGLFYFPFRLLFGTLYPAYASYKAVRTKNVKEYVSKRKKLFLFNF